MIRPTIPDEAVILAGVEGIGVQSFKALIGRLGLAGLRQAPTSELIASGLRRPLAQALRTLLDDRARFELVRTAIAAELEPDGRLADAAAIGNWPGIGDLDDCPLFVALNAGLDNDFKASRRIAIVGTREPSSTGLFVARELGRELASRGALIVSGGANGIDSAAHAGAIDADGLTVAVLGAALSQERANRPEHIDWLWRRAAVLTEQIYPWPPRKWMYPRRNRIIAALAEIVIVVEGRQRSGALLTARAAQRLGRPLLAVPGRVDDSVADCPNALLAERAYVCRHADDAWAALAALAQRPAPAQQLELEQTLTADELALLDLLRVAGGQAHVDEIAARLERTPAAVAEIVLRLELARRVCRDAGQMVRLPR